MGTSNSADGAREVSTREIHAEIVEETKGIVDRVKKFEEDDSVARETDICRRLTANAAGKLCAATNHRMANS